MAINNAVMNLALRLLVSLRSGGEKIDHAVAFGRQRLAVDATYFSDVLKLDRRLLLAEYCEPFFAQLGLTVDSIDFSDYEKATHIANLAEDNEHHFRRLGIEGRYDLVLDLGTSEHVVNPINSVVNAYRLAREGGYIVLNLPVAGWFNHGFFNFQPTFFTSISSEWLQLVSLTLFELELGENSRAAETRFVDPKRPIDLNRNVSSFAVYRKRGGLDVSALTCRTVQEVYR